jgi:hypothetical protein
MKAEACLQLFYFQLFTDCFLVVVFRVANLLIDPTYTTDKIRLGKSIIIVMLISFINLFLSHSARQRGQYGQRIAELLAAKG